MKFDLNKLADCVCQLDSAYKKLSAARRMHGDDSHAVDDKLITELSAHFNMAQDMVIECFMYEIVKADEAARTEQRLANSATKKKECE